MEYYLFKHCKLEISETIPDQDQSLHEYVTDDLNFKISKIRPLIIEKESATHEEMLKLLNALNDRSKRKEKSDQISEPSSSVSTPKVDESHHTQKTIPQGPQGNQANHDRRNWQHHEQGTSGGNKPLTVKAVKIVDIQSLSCEICARKFSSRLYYEGHMNKHKGIKPHCCQYCGKGYYYRQSLRQHEVKCQHSRSHTQHRKQ